MNKFTCIVVFALFFSAAHAQTVIVKKQSDKIKGEMLDGYATDLEGKRLDASNSLNKVLKDHGKIKFLSADPTILTSPTLNGALYPKGILYATVKENNTIVTIWIGTKPSEWEGTDMETINKQVIKLVYQAGIQFYRDKVQFQIDEAQQAAEAVDKQIARATSAGNDLVKNLANNGQEKIKLEQALETNKFDNAVLKVKIENNKKAKDSLNSAAVKIQQMKQVHEEKLKKIN